MNEEVVFRKIYRDVVSRGTFVSPRGQRVLEIENYTYELPAFVKFQSFESRKLNIQYIKDELLWYIRGDKFDLSITEKAKIWQQIVNSDMSINSNYGQYIFSGVKQFDNVVKTLSDDRDSRRGSMMILQEAHLVSDTKDVPCTYALNFRIRDNNLNMSVHMRSQDAIYGMGNDAPAFSFIHEMMLNALRRSYPDLMCGTYFHCADSFHVYERHFQMLEKLSGLNVQTKDELKDWRPDLYEKIECPRISGPDEVDFLRKLVFDDVPPQFKFVRWLVGVSDV